MALLIPRIFDMLSLIERRTFSQNQVYPSTRDFLEKKIKMTCDILTSTWFDTWHHKYLTTKLITVRFDSSMHQAINSTKIPSCCTMHVSKAFVMERLCCTTHRPPSECVVVPCTYIQILTALRGTVKIIGPRWCQNHDYARGEAEGIVMVLTSPRAYNLKLCPE